MSKLGGEARIYVASPGGAADPTCNHDDFTTQISRAIDFRA